VRNNLVLMICVPIMIVIALGLALLLYEQRQSAPIYRFILFVPYIISITERRAQPDAGGGWPRVSAAGLARRPADRAPVSRRGDHLAGGGPGYRPLLGASADPLARTAGSGDGRRRLALAGALERDATSS
jgi:hypothetical protein